MSNFSEFHDHQTGLKLKNRELNLCAVFVLWFSGGHLSFHLTALLLCSAAAAAVTHDQLPPQQSVTLPWSAGRWMMGKHSGGSCNASVTVGVGVSENLKSSSVPSFVPTKCLKGIEVNRGLFYMCLCDEKISEALFWDMRGSAAEFRRRKTIGPGLRFLPPWSSWLFLSLHPWLFSGLFFVHHVHYLSSSYVQTTTILSPRLFLPLSRKGWNQSREHRFHGIDTSRVSIDTSLPLNWYSRR